jgi:hypothetical protein
VANTERSIREEQTIPLFTSAFATSNHQPDGLDNLKMALSGNQYRHFTTRTNFLETSLQMYIGGTAIFILVKLSCRDLKFTLKLAENILYH